MSWAWNSKASKLQIRDNPPNCLVDSALGQHKYVKINGIKFHYVEAGTTHDHLLLLLHGFPDCWLSWRYQIPQLSEHFRVVALDLKGFGDSDKPEWRANYRIHIILEELKQFILTFKTSTVTIIGHDLGALLGWYLTYQEPKLINNLIAVSCPHPNIYWEALPTNNYINKQWLYFIQWPYLPEMDALKEDVKLINEHHRHLQKNGKQNSYLEAYKYTFSRKEDWSGPINYYRNLPFVKINEESEPIKQPTLLIIGSKKEYNKIQEIVISTSYLRIHKIKLIPGTGHFPHQEDPEKFNCEILDFLNVKSLQNKDEIKQPSKGFMDRMFGAVSTTVKYGNSVIDSVQKKASVASSIPSINFALTSNNINNLKRKLH